MAVYVDDMDKTQMGGLGGMKMSDMYAESVDELFDMANKIGLHRDWMQNVSQGHGYIHFDVSMAYRERAVREGAVEITMREMAKKRMEWRSENE